jgi:hypothetical protein
MINYAIPSVAFNLSNTVSAINTRVNPSAITPVISTTDSFIEILVQESQFWFENAYRASNDQLYDLLTKCYGYYFEMGKTDEAAKSLRKGLQNHIDSKGYRFNTGTHSLNKIVKCVFGFDRRRVSAYGSVLQIALQLKVPVTELGNYIRQAGGIEEIRLGGKSSKTVPTNQKAEEVATAVESVNLGQIAHDEISQQLDAGKVGKNTLLIGTWQADGSIVIRAVVDSDSLVKSALATQYNKLRDSLDIQKADVSTKVKTTARTDAVHKAAEKALLAA